MKIAVFGALGHMGREVCTALEKGYGGHTLAARIDAFGDKDVFSSLSACTVEADAVVDFSHHSAVTALLDDARAKKLPVVIATTGHTEAEQAAIEGAAKEIPVFYAANMSVGVALLVKLAKEAARAMPDADIEIIEKHHNRKLDAPSGTALMIANALKEVREETQFVFGRGGQAKREKSEIGIHAVRMGNVVGEHEVILCTDSQTITLTHQAHSRALFAEGALVAADFIAKQKPGLYSMKDMLGE
ncbi:MAG: 4-hydroxy-tetrahydrodipicolinate reductase [Clostridia bacterium]|nr:4-hydroxy-tetrahydrodipicolinate reductase [Clostridia bacterium]